MHHPFEEERLADCSEDRSIIKVDEVEYYKLQRLPGKGPKVEG